jgi:putative ABC transport system permease protein
VSLGDTFISGVEALLGHRMRSVLTVLGILIGIAAVILTVGLGEGASKSVSSEIASLGTNLLIVTPGSTTSSTGVRGGFGSASTLTLTDADALSSPGVAPDVSGVAPVASGEEELVAGSENWTTDITGTSAQYLSVRNRSVSEGRFFTAAEVGRGADVVVLGPTTAAELGAGVGSTVDVNDVPLTVVGVLRSAGSSASTDEDDVALVPVTTAQNQIFGSSGGSVSTIYVKARTQNLLSAAYQEVNGELLATHRITHVADADFTITTQQSILSTATQVDRTLTVLLAGIAAISLLVGGIGVMNIMLVAVAERVREIGLRKAVGATQRAIRRQFLVEASALGLVGGIAGVLLGVLGAAVLPHLASVTISLSLWASIGAVVVAIAIGLVFGVYPASRAARLAPIDALRSE